MEATHSPRDLYHLAVVSETYPRDVDARLDNNSLPGKVYTGFCQMIFRLNDSPGAHELAANHPGMTSLMLAALTNDGRAPR